MKMMIMSQRKKIPFSSSQYDSPIVDAHNSIVTDDIQLATTSSKAILHRKIKTAAKVEEERKIYKFLR